MHKLSRQLQHNCLLIVLQRKLIQQTPSCLDHILCSFNLNFKRIILLDILCLPVTELGAPQTRHGVFQVLTEIKNILHSPLPLRLRVCVKIELRLGAFFVVACVFIELIQTTEELPSHVLSQLDYLCLTAVFHERTQTVNVHIIRQTNLTRWAASMWQTTPSLN